MRLLSIAGFRRVAVTGLCLVAWRLLEQIPVASLNPLIINVRLQAVEPLTFLHAIGGAIPFASYSIAALGLQPYVMALIVVFLGDVLDEWGLGFGNGAILIYALSPLAVEVHRLAEIAASSPSLEALYRPLGEWVIFSVGVVVASVAVLLAVRRVPPADSEKSSSA